MKTGLTRNLYHVHKLKHLRNKHAPVDTARKLFDKRAQRSVHSWNKILKRYCSEKHYEEALRLFPHMLQSSVSPDHFTVSIALKACAKAEKKKTSQLGLKAAHYGKIIHGYVKKKNGEIGSNLFVASGLVEFYAKWGEMDEALRVFEEYREPDVVLWTTMLSCLDQNGEPEKALRLFVTMAREGGVVMDPVLLVCVVSGYARLLDLEGGRSVHGFLIKKGLCRGLCLSNVLLNLYAKVGEVEAAAELFRTMGERDVISWGSMISCYAHNGAASEASSLFSKMVSERVEPNTVVLISALQACEATGNLEEGKRIHELAARKGYDLDVLVSTSLIDMYMSCSSPGDAIELFERLPERDSVSWTSMLCGCVQNGLGYTSVEVFRDMVASEVRPDGTAMLKILAACSELGILQLTSSFHGYVIRGGFDDDAFVQASLIESYSKCGNLEDALKLFESTKERDVVIWSAMFAAYGVHGQARESLELLSHMVKSSSARPNNVTFLSILAACSHAGLVHEGIETFNKMVNDYQLTPKPKHYGIIVDMLGRAGEVEKAIDLIKQMEAPVGAHVWGALLGACRIHQNTEVAEVAAQNLFQSDPDTGHYILLSNMYAFDGRWENVAEVRNLMRRKQLKKLSGQSVVELRNGVHSFIANDRFHPETEQIYLLLRGLETKMRKQGDVTDALLLHV